MNQAIVFDFGEGIDRTRYRRWHFCKFDERFLIRTIGTVRIYLN